MVVARFSSFPFPLPCLRQKHGPFDLKSSSLLPLSVAAAGCLVPHRHRSVGSITGVLDPAPTHRQSRTHHALADQPRETRPDGRATEGAGSPIADCRAAEVMSCQSIGVCLLFLGANSMIFTSEYIVLHWSMEHLALDRLILTLGVDLNICVVDFYT